MCYSKNKKKLVLGPTHVHVPLHLHVATLPSIVYVCMCSPGEGGGGGGIANFGAVHYKSKHTTVVSMYQF